MAEESAVTEFLHAGGIIVGTALVWIFTVDKLLAMVHPALAMTGPNQIVGVESPSGLLAVGAGLLLYHFDRKRRGLEGLKRPSNQN